ncbi:MAG: phospholipase [Gemmatimonadetes bacterium]|nr:phospholipase [Gemmatimonadota bacterium]
MADLPIVEHHIPVARTARYYTLGPAGASAQEVWLVCHGYGQLARFFLRRFAPLDDGTRLIVAPEGMSRFYLSDPGGSHAKARVGATWMTREDRLTEIQDYVAYLDAVYQRVVTGVPHTIRRFALGFSQGVATACRWAALGAAGVDDLILWAERVPPDLDLAGTAERLRRMRITLVTGATDPAVPPGASAEERDRLAQHGIPSEMLTFPGGHELDADTLRAIADRARSLARGQANP